MTTVQTMWHVAFRYSEDTAGGVYGDDAVGTARVTNYRKDGEPWKGAEISYYVEYVRATNQPGQPMRYANRCLVEYWEGKPEDDPENWRQNSEYDYPDGDILWYHTEEQAQRAVDRYGKMDESQIFLN